MIPAACKRLIEVDFPIAKVSEHAAREKSIRHGHPSTLHLWWARRPLAACRAVLLGLLLPDPCDKHCPPEFKTTARTLLAKRFSRTDPTDEALRQMLLDFIAEFADWDRAASATYLEIGRGLVKAAHPAEMPVVADPFAGGGSIPLEALRLGCEAFASDLNPVACLILKTLLEDIPRHGDAEFRLQDKDGKEAVVHGLANALRHVGRQVKEAAEKELAAFYPIDSDGSRPIAYLWARTVRCEAIGCGAEIPLVRSFWLSKKSIRRRAFRFKGQRSANEPPCSSYEIFAPKSEHEVPNGTVNRANATCLCCNNVLPAARVRAQLAAQKGGADATFDANGNRVGGARLLAVVTLSNDLAGRQYRLPMKRDYDCVWRAMQRVGQLPEGVIPNEPTPKGGGSGAGRAFCYQKYGMASFGDLFSARQRIGLAKIADEIRAFRTAPRALSLAIGKLADLANAICRWEPKAECPRNVFAAGRVKPAWDFAEANPLSESSGSFLVCVENLAQGVESIGEVKKTATCELAKAQDSPLPSGSIDCWFTDPPYYDAYPYADLADVFLVWLKRTLPSEAILHDPFDDKNQLSPKEAEIVQDESRSCDGREKDKVSFEQNMAASFAEGARLLKEGGVACVVFAHKTTEGWEALLSGIINGGFAVTASWPIATEQAHRLRAKESAALGTSVHLVCRPRGTEVGVGDWSEVKAAMEKRIREWLPMLAKHGVRGADAIFSCLGPALESYSQFERVLTAADHEVPLGGDPDATEPHERGFLAYVFETLSKEALRQVLGDAETEGFEEDARLTALFLWTLQSTKTNGNGTRKPDGPVGTETDETDDEDEKPKKARAGLPMPFDTFIRITRPMGIHYAALEGSIIAIEKGIVRLLAVRERTEQLLGESAERSGVEISLEDVKQLELGLVMKRREETALPVKSKRGKKAKAAPEGAPEETVFTTLDRLHRAMLLFGLGRSTLLRQVLGTELRQSKRFERLALALNALYPDGSEERRMLEGVQAAMRGIK